MSDKRRRSGRPSLHDEPMGAHTIFTTKDQWEAVQDRGGAAYIRNLIDNDKEGNMAIEYSVGGTYTFAHMEQFPPERHGSGTYEIFKTEEEARATLETWRDDPRFAYLTLFEQRRLRNGEVETIWRETHDSRANPLPNTRLNEALREATTDANGKDILDR